MDNDRIQREIEFHNDRFGSNESTREKVDQFYSVMRAATEYYTSKASSYCKDKKLLEYGCGTGSYSLQWLKLGAIVSGIDISDEAIKIAKKNISGSGYNADYFVMNAEKTEFPDNCYDIIVGSGILHHLDLNNSFAELFRLLNNNGHAIFLEPLGHNPLINLFRKLTPSMRTEDEHPLREKDLQLARKYFSRVNAEYFSLFTLIAIPFRSSKHFNSILSFLEKMDRSIMRIFPFLKKHSWAVVLEFVKL
ncbi:MAG: methyltransferase domain-containing protein [Acidobacteriota bacterium]